MTRAAKDFFILSAVAAVIVALNALFFVQRSDPREDELSGDRSTYSGRLYGTKAFFTLLNRAGISTIRWEDSLVNLPGPPGGHVVREGPTAELDAPNKRAPTAVSALLMMEPRVPPNREESRRLADWVKSGGRLILIGRNLRWPFEAESVRVSAHSSRWNIPRVLLPSPLTLGVRHVQLTPHAAHMELEGAPAIAHIGDPGGSLLLDLRYGQGEIILLGEPFVVANNGITAADNAVLGLNLVSHLPSGVVAFDERHHAHPDAAVQSPLNTNVLVRLWNYSARTSARAAIIQIGILGILGLYSASRRFGRVRRQPPNERARAYEYVTSLAALHEGMRAHTLALENIYRGFTGAITRRTGVQGDLLKPENIDLVSQRAGIPGDRLRRLLERCEQALEDDQISDSQLIHLAADLKAVEKLLHA